MFVRARWSAALVAALFLAGCGATPPVDDGGSTGGGGGSTGGGGGSTGGGGGSTGGGGGTDVIAPTIRSTTPVAGATEVALDVAFVVAFSEAMNASSVTVTITPAVALGAPVFDADDESMTVVPSAPLAPNTLYTLSIDGQDRASNALTGIKSFSFTSRLVDVTAPTVASTLPANNAASVAVGSSLAITFSEPMDVATVTVGVSPVTDLGQPVWSPDNVTMTFTPPAGLVATSTYSVSLEGQDLGGNPLGGSKTFTFTTGAPPDTTPPTVTDTTPGDGDTSVSNNTLITINFSEPMRQTDTQAALQLLAVATPLTNCDTHWLWNAQRTIASCQPSPALAFSTVHHVTVGIGAKDDAGNALAAPFTFTFTIGAAPDTTPPTVSSVTPTNLSIGAERNTLVTVNFSESMDTTATQGAFACSYGMGSLGGTATWFTRNRVLRFSLSSTLSSGATVTCTVRGGATGARDGAGNRLAADYQWSFRVLRATSVVAPAVALLDGYVLNTGATYPADTRAFVGDTTANLSARAFFTFNLSGVTTEIRRVTSATLYLYIVGGYGVAVSLGTLLVEHVDYGATLTSTDYGVSALETGRTVSIGAGSRVYNMTTEVQGDLTNRTARGNRSQFRMRFTTEVTPDAATDGLLLSVAEWGTPSQRPRLVVAYEYP